MLSLAVTEAAGGTGVGIRGQVRRLPIGHQDRRPGAPSDVKSRRWTHRQSARKRRQLAGALSQRMHHGDGDAAFRLLQRGRALKGVKKLGWRWRLAMANAARKRNHEALLAAKAAATERRRIEEDCTVTSPKALAALRVRYGTGVVRGDYADGECRLVAPGGKCPAYAWRWGNPVPHLIAVP
jgi:hypothetical protein